MAEPQYDAFGNILSLDSDLDKPSTYNIYENRAFSSGQGANLQNVYGIQGGLPMFQFIRQIKTGERTYDPTRPEDRDFRDQYERYQQQNPQAPTFADVIGETAMGLAPRVGSAVGQALINPGDYLQGDALSRAGQGALDTFTPSPYETVNRLGRNFDPAFLSKDQAYIPELENLKIAQQTGNKSLMTELKPFETQIDVPNDSFFGKDTVKQKVYDTGKMADSGYTFNPEGELFRVGDTPGTFDPTTRPDAMGVTKVGNLGAPVTASTSSGFGGYVENVGGRLNPSTTAGASNYSAAGGAGLFAAATTLVLTGDVEKAAKTGAGTAIGQSIGTALLPGIGTVVGGIIGGALGGRVICNELCNQGIIDRKMLINDYKFTRDYLTPSHVKGYHLWALWMVKQMRKGKFVGLWSHIVIHRGNEIAYIYGERKKPDYLGKLYRKIFEPVCWVLGAFSKETDWSILYQKKEI
jgi:hypothetical protein